VRIRLPPLGPMFETKGQLEPPRHIAGIVLIAARLFERLGEFNLVSVLIGAAALLTLVLLKRQPRVPGAFVVLVAGIALAYAMISKAMASRSPATSTLFLSRRRYLASRGMSGAG
jgi:hypothetical protein